MRPVDAATIKRTRAQLIGDPGLAGHELGRRLAQQADSWLRGLGGQLGEGWALCATGGYAHGVLAPGSDIDVVLVHPPRSRDDEVRRVAETIWYPLWDGGLKLGQAVHSQRTLAALASGDLDTATSLLRVRHLAGDPSVSAAVERQALEQWRRRPNHWLELLLASASERWARLGDVASRLEPDLKDGRGGLRDRDVIRWVLRFDRPEIEQLFDTSPEDLAGPADLLVSVRCELHRATGRTSNVLQLQDQDRVAAAMGFSDADTLMRRVAGAAHAIEWATDRFWRRVERMVHRVGSVPRSGSLIAPGVIVVDGEACIAVDADVDEPSYVFHLAASAAHAGLPVSVRSLQALSGRGVPPGEPWDERTRQAFLSLLGAGTPLVASVAALERYDLFSRYLPEWRLVRSLPQRNAFHTYTVDRHLLQTVVNANDYLRDVSRPDLLLAGALFHDIGKGHPGDHTEVGIRLVREIAARMGFPDEDTEVLVALVAHHLLLPETATRRDLGDPRTTANVVAAVGSPLVLMLLDRLTRADSLATGPSAWSTWKESLVDELVQRTLSAMRGEGIPAEPLRDMSRHGELIARLRDGGALQVQHSVEGEFDVLHVASLDRSGLFSLIAGTLSLHSVDVVAAEAVTTADGIVIDEFRALRIPEREVPWQRIQHDLRAALDGQFDLDARLQQRMQSRTRRRPIAATPPRREVLISNDASDRATMIDVRAADGPAVLYLLSHELAAAGLDVWSAKVATLGHEVVDVFYVTQDGAKVAPNRHEQLREQLKQALDR